jgi:hypothetical protein
MPLAYNTRIAYPGLKLAAPLNCARSEFEYHPHGGLSFVKILGPVDIHEALQFEMQIRREEDAVVQCTLHITQNPPGGFKVGGLWVTHVSAYVIN